MGARLRVTLLLFAVGAVALGAGCRGERDGPHRAGRLRAAPSASAELETPVDSTRPGEIAEGEELAFGLRLPRELRIEARFADATYARGKLRLEDVANYVRERVAAERIDTGPTKTVIMGARVRGARDNVVRIEVTARGGETELVVRNETPRPLEESERDLSEADWWRRAGHNPDGTLIDERKVE